MSDASTKQAVECPICGEEFDPTVAGGWCTNTECGEWQYTGEPDTESEADTAADEDDRGASEVFAAAGADADGDDDPDIEADVETTDDGESEWETKGQAEESADEVDDASEDVELLDEAASEPVEDDADDGTDAAVEEEAESVEDEADSVEGEAESVEDEAESVEDEADEAGEAEEADEADEAEVDAEPEPEPSTIDCPDCGVELDAEANFCVECGADVQDVTPGEDEDDTLEACPGCGVDVDEDDNFCVECGEDLDAHRAGDEPEDDEAAAEAEPEDAIDALGGSGEDEPAEAPESLVLEVAGNRIPVEDGDKVGREIRAALMDAGRPEEEAVRIHREHVRFVREADTFYLVDLGDNPTALNGKTLTKGDREPVAPGDELELSGVATVSVLSP